MLLTNRRTALIHLCLAAAQVAWVTPFWLLLYRNAPPVWISYAFLLAILLAWILVLELLSRLEPAHWYEPVALLLMALTSLAAVRLALYGDRPLTDVTWLGRAVRDTLAASSGLPPVLVLIGVNLLLWQRATAATSRDLSFHGVGVTFRLGLLILIVGGGLYTGYRGPGVTPLLWLYLAAGLTALALARISEKSIEAQSAGVPLPPWRLVQMLLALGLVLGALAMLSRGYTPESIQGFLRFFAPLWQLLRPLVIGLLLLLARLLNPLLLWLEAQLADLLARGFAEPAGPAVGAPGEQVGLTEGLAGWPLDLIKSVLVGIAVVGIVLGVIVLLLLYLERVRRSRRGDGGEEEDTAALTFGGGILGRGMASLRRAARLVRRVGLGPGLLAAVSVQNIYANLCRIARRRGYGRPPSQPPDVYLLLLRQAFPGQEDALDRLTAAYMRVHYGDRPVALSELHQLRQDYRAVREAGSGGNPGRNSD